jgi:hypothetical protein
MNDQNTFFPNPLFGAVQFYSPSPSKFPLISFPTT